MAAIFTAWPAWIVYAYILFAVVNALTPAYTECVTDDWCLSSRADWWLMALFQTALIVVVAVAARFALVWALRMLVSKHRHWWFLAFFTALGLFGIVAWLATVPRADWGAFAHIPILSACFAGLGVLMFFGFRPRPPGQRRRK